MKTLNLIYLKFVQLIKQICALPESIKKAVQQRRRQMVLIENEAERLDRIRNPEKYRGK